MSEDNGGKKGRKAKTDRFGLNVHSDAPQLCATLLPYRVSSPLAAKKKE